jgi:hypothetical protein
MSNDLRNILREVTQGDVPYIRKAIVREVNESNKTCNVEPYDSIAFNKILPNPNNYIYDIVYKAQPPTKDTDVIIGFLNKTDAEILEVGTPSSFQIGDSNTGTIVLGTKVGAVVTGDAETTNTTALYALLGDRFKIDLVGNVGVFNYTGKEFSVIDVGQFRFGNKCGNIFEINCDGINNWISKDGKFLVAKSGSVDYSQVMTGCNVADIEYATNVNIGGITDVSKLVSILLSVKVLDGSSLVMRTKDSFFNDKITGTDITLAQLYEGTPIYDRLSKGNIRTNNAAEASKDLINSNVILAKKFYVVKTPNTLHYHSKFSGFVNEIKNIINTNKDNGINTQDEITKLLFTKQNFKYWALPVVSSCFNQLADLSEEVGITNIFGSKELYNKIQSIFSSLYSLPNGFDYENELEKCNTDYTDFVDAQAEVTLADLHKGHNNHTRLLIQYLTQLINGGVTTPSGAGTFTVGSAVLSSLNQLKTDIDIFETSNVDFLLEDLTP